MRALYYLLAAALGFCVLCALMIGYVEFSSRPYIYSSSGVIPHAQVALVPGASIIGTSTLSAVLQERADEAALLYKAGVVEKILVTGDDSALSHDEVDPVGRYLVGLGIPKEDIFLDHAGFDTYSSMYRARDVFGVSSAIIVSQRFHLPRAIFIARSLGLVAYGVDAGKGEPFLFNYAREIPATLKALFDIVRGRVPEYLGPAFNIEGSATSTWVY